MKTKKLLAVIVTIALLMGLFQMTTTNVSAADTTVTFDGVSVGLGLATGMPAGYGGLTWGGSGQGWWVYNDGGVKSAWINSEAPSGTGWFDLPAGNVLKSVKLWTGAGNNMTFTCGSNPSRVFTTTNEAEMTKTLDWTDATSNRVNVALSCSNGIWDMVILSITYGPGGPTAATTTVPTAATTAAATTKPDWPDVPGEAYYVSTEGSDSADGKTTGTAFRTIQKAADTMIPGDTCYIMGGTYRETVIPKHSGTAEKPIIYKNYNSEKVTISGADLVTTEWIQHSGNIYKTDIGSKSAEQVFVNGYMHQKARWPNNPISHNQHPNFFAATSSTVENTTGVTAPYDFVTAPASIPPGDWTGAKIWLNPGRQWVSFMLGITNYNSMNRRLTIDKVFNEWYMEFGNAAYYTRPDTNTPFYLFDHLLALDQAGEFYAEKEGNNRNLYLWATNNANPNNQTVEFKVRDMGLNLSNKEHIEFEGVNFFACTIRLEDSKHCVVKDGSVLYPEYFDRQDGYELNDCGILVSGEWNKIDNMEIAYATGAGVWIKGKNNALVNSKLHDVNWAGAEYGGVSYGEDTFPNQPDPDVYNNVLISNNKIYNTGKMAILGLGSHFNKILFNEIYDVGKNTHDLGLMYIYYTGGIKEKPSEIAYNYCYNNYGGSGIYFDTYTDTIGVVKGSYAGQNYVIHHNVITNVAWAAFHVNGGNPALGPLNLKFYNNTAHSCGGIVSNWVSTAGFVSGDIEYINNIGIGAWNPQPSAVDQNNMKTGNPQFVRTSGAQTNMDFSLQANSPAINKGKVIPGITDGYQGEAPDQGAFEFGVPRVRVKSMNFDKDTLKLDINASHTLQKVFSTANPTVSGAYWHSSDPAVATIDENGIVNGVSDGLAVIKAMSFDGGFIAKCVVTVGDPPIPTGTTTITGTTTVLPPVKGDINGDGKVNGMDLLLMKQHILDIPGKTIGTGIPAFKAADMNDDERINGMDLLLLKKKILT